MKYFLISIEMEEPGEIYGPFNTLKEAKEALKFTSFSACVIMRGTIIEKVFK